MIAWLGWELLNAEQDVDVRGVNLHGFKKIPLGSYVEGLLNIKGSDIRKIGTARQ